MVFRFGCALVLVVLVAMAGVALEKRCLDLRRSIARQRYRLDVLEDLHARLRLRTHELGSPTRTRETLTEKLTRGRATRE
ncbi:MAG TPA: hypothetical protein VML55_26285 [Planctomycetaceae bacterium]|nr:hypothetical protein [Planctomycetaceae bacterium]